MAGLMKQWTIDALGAQNLKLTERAIPEAGPGDVLVRTTAISLNFRDKLVLENGMGMPIAFPFVPGSDMAGVVEAVGSGVSRFQPGDRVISVFDPTWIDGQKPGTARHPTSYALGGLNPGVASEYVAFPEGWFVQAPESVDDGEACTLPCAGVTAWYALVEKGRPKAGDRVVVQGTGGVSLFGLQIAKAHGAEVIVTSSNRDKLDRALELGADHGIDRANEDWVERVLEITGDRGADHILELAGGANLGRSLQAVAVQGRISVIGVFEGAEISAPVTPVLLKSPVIQGIGVGHRRALEDLVAAVDRTGLKPVVDARYPFGELSAALAHLDRGAFGKVVIEV
ncbi:NAD(P)-dependent alcohol dehydrogenase [Ensifer sp.]|uniref:zinc-dependent alcohol dehydrogenase family protein n=1 Tax=Ensifer sp. TaxID=1872086 RepID=UPI00289AC103|nr:NAD(P)-dependent alcohol dehydrogenase [Ensifer sp.]